MGFEGTANNIYFRTAGGSLWQCEKATIRGEFTTGKEVKAASERYTGCSTEGDLYKEFETTALKGKVGLAKGNLLPALRLEPAEGTTFVKRFKGAPPLTGSIIGMLSPQDQKVSEFTLTYAISEGLQSPSNFFKAPLPKSVLEWVEIPILEEATFHVLTTKPITIENNT